MHIPAKDKLVVVWIPERQLPNDLHQLEGELGVPNLVFKRVLVDWLFLQDIVELQVDGGVVLGLPDNFGVLDSLVLVGLFWLFVVDPVFDCEVVVAILVPFGMIEELELQVVFLVPWIFVELLNDLHSDLGQKTFLCFKNFPFFLPTYLIWPFLKKLNKFSSMNIL